MTRRRGREVALQVLYQAEVNPGIGARDRARFLKGRLRSGPLVEFAEGLIAGVESRRPELDAMLDSRSENWRVARMAATDRGVLRIALYELLHTETPGPVVVDEAIELARRYGNDASPRFVAGILGRLLADRAAAGSAPAAG
jgi:N utilization substance protein B